MSDSARSKNDAKQDADEMRWVAEMAAGLGLELASAPTKQKEPKPDILLTLTDGKRVGVEVVEAMDESARRAYSGARKRIVLAVTAEMKRRGMRANVGLSFPEGFVALLGNLTRNAESATCGRIVDCVAEALSSPLPDGRLGWMFDERGPNVASNDQFRHLGGLIDRGIEYLNWLQVSRWHEAVVLTAVSTPIQGPDVVQAAIDRKAVKHCAYDLDGIAEMWLLVVGGLGTGGSLSSQVVERHSFTSPFWQTIFFDCWESKCVRLRTNDPQSS